MLQTIGANKSYITKIPGFLFQQVHSQFNAPLGHTKGRIDQPLHRSWLPPEITQVQVNLVVRYCAIKLFFKCGWVGEINVATRSHISTNHDAIYSLWWVCYRHVNYQHLLAVLTQDIPRSE